MDTSDTQLPMSLDEARKSIVSGRYSRSLWNILERASVSQDESEVAAKSDPMLSKWSLLGVIYAAAVTRSEVRGAAQVFADHHEFADALTSEEVETHTLSRTTGTEELAAALQDAAAIRESTGGKDNFIGLRHALFAILLPPDPARFADTYEMLAAGGTSPTDLAQLISSSCIKWAEKEEDREVWSALIDKRLEKIEATSFAAPQGALVATPGADDPWAPGTVDRSGARLEAEAFASMICWRHFKPPLAVGVFGDWGAGKSFFMRLVHDAIVAQSGRSSADKQERSDFLEHVVQIRFNAWHYAETNLWASLVDHILTELDTWAMTRQQENASNEVFARLDTARDWTLQAARDLIKQRKAKKGAEEKLKNANADLKAKKEALAADPEAWREGVWSKVYEEIVDPALKQAAKDLGLTEKDFKAPDDLRHAMALYQPESGGGGEPRLAALSGKPQVLGDQPRCRASTFAHGLGGADELGRVVVGRRGSRWRYRTHRRRHDCCQHRVAQGTCQAGLCTSEGAASDRAKVRDGGRCARARESRVRRSRACHRRG